MPTAQAIVTVASKRGEPAIKPEEIKAVLDLTNKETGVYNVPVQLVAPDVVVQSLSPASVTLTVEKLEEHPFPVTVHYVGTLPTGIVVSDAQTEPQAAVVRGPMSLLAQVAAVHVDVTLPSEPKALDEMVRPTAVNAGGVEVAGLAVAPNLVRLRVRFVAGVRQDEPALRNRRRSRRRQPRSHAGTRLSPRPRDGEPTWQKRWSVRR